MTAPERTCPVSGQRLAPDEYVGPAGVRTLRGLLTGLPSRVRDLEGALARELRFADPQPGSGSSTPPLPFNPAAGDALRALSISVTYWTKWVGEVRGHWHTSDPRQPTWASCATYLAAQAEWLARHPEGERAYPALVEALRAARRAVDRPADKVYAGRCEAMPVVDGVPGEPCPQELYALPSERHVQCRRCGTTHDVQERRDTMLALIRDRHMPAADLARAITALTGTALSVNTVRSWAQRGHIQPTGTNHRGQPTYHVATVLEHMREGAQA